MKPPSPLFFQGKTLAFIPLRGGSLSIPLKNIKPLGGRPLAYYVIDAADACSQIDAIVVSTDSPLIEEIILQHPSQKITVVNRSAEVSTAEASTESVMLEFAEAYPFQTMVLIQATSPLLQAEHLGAGLSLAKGHDSVLSVVRQHRFLWDEATGQALNYVPSKRPRRQDWKGMLMENGAFYITGREALLQSRCRLSGNIGLCEMPAETYIELDEPLDWLMAEQLLQKRQSISLAAIKMFLCDCDGTLTDSGMYYGTEGESLKKFNTRDGHAFQMLNGAGLITGIVTGENSPIVQARGTKIKAREIRIGVRDKLSEVQTLAQSYGFTLSEVAYMGDDTNDLELLAQVGFAAAPGDAIAEVKALAHYVSPLRGGEGAVRDAAEYLLRHRL